MGERRCFIRNDKQRMAAIEAKAAKNLPYPLFFKEGIKR
jgi:hypothetical protein